MSGEDKKFSPLPMRRPTQSIPVQPRPETPPEPTGERQKGAPAAPMPDSGTRRKTIISGTGNSFVFEMVRTVLLRYLGQVTVDGALSAACKRTGVAPETMRARELEAFVRELTSSLRLLCDAEKMPKLLGELEQLHRVQK